MDSPSSHKRQHCTVALVKLRTNATFAASLTITNGESTTLCTFYRPNRNTDGVSIGSPVGVTASIARFEYLMGVVKKNVSKTNLKGRKVEGLKGLELSNLLSFSFPLFQGLGTGVSMD